MNRAPVVNMGTIVLYDILGREHPGCDAESQLNKVVQWLCTAHDATSDGGVSEGYHLFHGWLPSYPETTGYIIETFFDYYHLTGDQSLRERAIRMADWLLSVQHPDGAIPDSQHRRKLVFDTGQVLFGLVRAYRETGSDEYRDAATRAGAWLVSVQNPDGAWRRHALGEAPHTYYSRVAWSLLELHSVTQSQDLVDAAISNIRWVQQQQRESGWFDCAGFSPDSNASPFTHTIAYTIRGVLECGLYLKDAEFVRAARGAVDGLLQHLPDDGRAPGTYDSAWRGDSSFSCLTGDAQLAIILHRLHRHTGRRRYLLGAGKIMGYLATKQELRASNPNLHGAIAGSDPIWGKYIHFCYPNWAAKFFADALLLAGETRPEA
jgi:rhamnogalacturonyl hydrolase YesR